MEAQSTMLADEQQAKMPDPICLPTRHHAALAVVALEDRAGTVESLAKKARDEGYHRISRELQADVDMIREEILPEVREQRELALAGPDEARAAIANFITASVHAAVASKEKEDQIVDRIARRLAPVFEHVYTIGFAIGVSNRLNEPEYAVVRACAKAAEEQSRE